MTMIMRDEVAGAPRRATAAGAFERDVLAGLSARRKTLPSKHLYDAAGSKLFEDICDVPEYYPTRTEIALLRAIAPDLAATIAEGAALVEFGSGASVKTRIVLDAAPKIGLYIPIDISEDALEEAATAIRRDYPRLEVAPLVGDFTQALELPAEAKGRPHIGFFPGSTIGNFAPPDALRFLKSARALLGSGARFILGADLIKSEATLIAAYDDLQGVTAAFNLNLLRRINRELDGDADVSGFEHRAIWNSAESRMEMHIVSRRAQSFSAAGRTFAFAAGETIHTENSYKFTVEGLEALAAQAGWRPVRHWISDGPAFAELLFEAD